MKAPEPRQGIRFFQVFGSRLYKRVTTFPARSQGWKYPDNTPCTPYTILVVHPPMMRRGFGVSLVLVIIDDSSPLDKVYTFFPVFRLSSSIRTIAFKCSELHLIRFIMRSLYRERLPFLFRLCAIHSSQAHCLASSILPCSVWRPLFSRVPTSHVFTFLDSFPSFLPLPCRTCKALGRLLYTWRLRAFQCARPHC